MAKITTLENAEKPAPVLARNGRAKAEEPVSDEVLVQQDKRLPKIGNPAAGSNQEFLESITDKEWQNLTCYVYRTAPSIDRQAAGKEISIDKVGTKFDMKDIVNRHGSGRYKFVLSYAPPSGGQWIRVRQWYETVFDMEKPPRVPLGDWLDNPANKDWEWCRPLLRAEEVIREQQAAEKIGGKQHPQQNAVEQLKETIELAKGMLPGDSSQAILLKLLEQSGPAQMLTMAKDLAELRQPSSGTDNNAMVMLLLDHLLKKENPAPVDPLETTTKLIQGVKGLMEGIGAPTAAAPKLETGALIVQQAGDILSKAIEQFGPYVPAMIDLVRHVKNTDLQIAQVSAARGMNPQRPWEYQGTPNNPPVQSTPIPPPPVPTENQPMTPQVFFAKHQVLLGEIFPLLKDKFDNETGYDLADWIIDRKGRDAYNTIRKDGTVELLMQIAAAVPQLNQIFQPADKAREFFEDFLCDPDNRPEEEEAEAEPEGAPLQ